MNAVGREPVSRDSATLMSQQPLHAGAVQTLCRLATVHNDVDELGVVNPCHGADLFSLRFQRDAPVSLLVRRNPRSL
jgi:hypothetical protein